jgi:LAO/AO transport system kinase
MKRGIMELADAILINKSDGDNIERANRAKTEYTNALHLFPLPPSKWMPQVKTCSSIEETGISDVWDMILNYKKFVTENGYFHERRSEQSTFWMFQTLNEGLKLKFFNDPHIQQRMKELETLIHKDQISSFAAAAELLDKFFSHE